MCLSCSGEAHFTYKHSHLNGEVNDIGGIDKYIPVCRGCFLSLSEKARDLDKLTRSKESSDTKSKSGGSLSDKEVEETDDTMTEVSCQ